MTSEIFFELTGPILAIMIAELLGIAVLDRLCPLCRGYGFAPRFEAAFTALCIFVGGLLFLAAATSVYTLWDEFSAFPLNASGSFYDGAAIEKRCGARLADCLPQCGG